VRSLIRTRPMGGRTALNREIRVRLLGPELAISLFDNFIAEDEGCHADIPAPHPGAEVARPPEERKVSVRLRGVGPRVGSKRWRCTGLLNRRTWVRFPPDPPSERSGRASQWVMATVSKTDERQALRVRLPPLPLTGCSAAVARAVRDREVVGSIPTSPTVWRVRPASVPGARLLSG
jgi:hypothetical protein